MFHLRLCLLHDGAAHADFPLFWPQRQWRRYGTNPIVSWNNWDLAQGSRRWQSFLAAPATGFKRYAYPLAACCLLIACSGVLATIRILKEMRLDYSPIYASFGYKTTEQLWHWRALLRGILCSQDDAVLYILSCSFRLGVCGGMRGLCVQ